MISAMPAVALRREQRGTSKPGVTANGKAVQPPALVDYYHKKISRLSSLPPSRRNYSTSTSLTSPDTESGRTSYADAEPQTRCRRIFRRVTLFHIGCSFLAVGLLMLFVGVGSIKGDVTPIRAVGSSVLVLGALLCLVHTMFFRQADNVLPLGLRPNDSFVTRQSRSPTSPNSTDPFPPNSPMLASDGDDDAMDDSPLTDKANGGIAAEDTSETAVTSPSDDRSPGQQETEGLLRTGVVLSV